MKHTYNVEVDDWLPVVLKALKIKGEVTDVYVRSIVGNNLLTIEVEE